MSVELHLPDLPEVPISLGPARSAPAHLALPWHLRLRAAISAYLPLLLMALLALATWWLVKNSPRPQAAPDERPVSRDPDYTMTHFALERFDKTGRLSLRIEGALLRHFPVSDRIEIDDAQIRAYAADGGTTLARAQRALGSDDGSELQLLGGAEVTSVDAAGDTVLMRSEFLHAFLVTERVQTHLPVRVQRGQTEMQASGLDYDHAARRLELKGPVRVVLAPRSVVHGRRG
jgi:lipopolysaccharide export system protein LptC